MALKFYQNFQCEVNFLFGTLYMLCEIFRVSSKYLHIVHRILWQLFYKMRDLVAQLLDLTRPFLPKCIITSYRTSSKIIKAAAYRR